MLRRDDIAIGPVEGLERLSLDTIPHQFKLNGKIVFDCHEMLRCRRRVALSDQCLKVGAYPGGHSLCNDLGSDALMGKNFQ